MGPFNRVHFTILCHFMFLLILAGDAEGFAIVAEYDFTSDGITYIYITGSSMEMDLLRDETALLR